MSKTGTWVLTPEHFERERRRLQQRRVDADARHAAEVAEIVKKLAELDRLAQQAAMMVARYAALTAPAAGTALAPETPSESAASAAKPAAVPALPSPAPRTPSRPFLSKRSMILQAVRAGMKERAEIIRYVRETFATEVKPKDTTTYLRRLRVRKDIKLHMGRWYPVRSPFEVEHPPAGLVSQPGSA